jgi:5-methylcytosine-specific restriction endonuclease McrA
MMGRKAKPTPEKYCQYCGTKMERKREADGDLESLLHFGRRKFCNQICMAKAFDQRHKPDAEWSAAHRAARQLVPPGPCAKCGKPGATDVHHKNENWQDNRPENLERLCRPCHNLTHKRRKACVICGKPQKGLGYCEKHYQRFKKYGDPLAFKRNQHTPLVRLED